MSFDKAISLSIKMFDEIKCLNGFTHCCTLVMSRLKVTPLCTRRALVNALITIKHCKLSALRHSHQVHLLLPFVLAVLNIVPGRASDETLGSFFFQNHKHSVLATDFGGAVVKCFTVYRRGGHHGHVNLL